MSLRDWMNENSSLATIAAVVLLVIAVAVVIFQGGDGAVVEPPQVWFYDQTADEYFQAASDMHPPIQSPAGNEAVRVYFFSCGECNEADRFVGYYEKYTPEALAAMEQAGNDKTGQQMASVGRGAIIEGRLISADLNEWISGASHEAQMMTSRDLSLRCRDAGGKLKPCHAPE